MKNIMISMVLSRHKYQSNIENDITIETGNNKIRQSEKHIRKIVLQNWSY